MEIIYRLAQTKDLDAIMNLMENTVQAMADTSLYVADDRATVLKHIGDEGEIVLAKAGTLAGFLMVRYPGLAGDNLGRDLGLDEKELLKVAHMESTAVASDFRGQGIMAALIRYGEALAQNRGCKYSMCTVSPDNPWSLSNMLARGYEIAATVPKYGGVLRHILMRRL